MKTFLTALLFGPITMILIPSDGFAQDYSQDTTNSCDDRDRIFKVCLENQSADIYANAVSEVHKQGKDALIIQGLDGASDRYEMLANDDFFEDIRQKIGIVPIATTTHIVTPDGQSVSLLNSASQEYFQRLGISGTHIGNSSFRMLILVKQGGGFLFPLYLTPIVEVELGNLKRSMEYFDSSITPFAAQLSLTRDSFRTEISYRDKKRILKKILEASLAQDSQTATGPCDNGGRIFKECPKDQGVDVYAKTVSEVHNQGKDALIIFCDSFYSPCDRAYRMLTKSKNLDDIRQKMAIIPIATHTRIETQTLRSGTTEAILTFNFSAREYFQSLGLLELILNLEKLRVPKLILVKQGEGRRASVLHPDYVYDALVHDSDNPGSLTLKELINTAY